MEPIQDDRPLLLDLFCGAGGAAVGYERAGFDVVGVDIKPQPHYPFEFHQADALEWLRLYMLDYNATGFAAYHASPPCQAYSTTRTLHRGEYPALVGEVRRLLRGLPYVIENVVGAPLINPVKMCGSSFGLPIRRHRLFESTLPLMSLGCAHKPDPIDVTGGGPSKAPRLDGAGGRSRKPKNVAEAGAALGIDWMTRDELNEAVPPAYTQFIGEQLLDQLKRVSV
jgi:DNA (cytosine-5)-methyltransferase 1